MPVISGDHHLRCIKACSLNGAPGVFYQKCLDLSKGDFSKKIGGMVNHHYSNRFGRICVLLVPSF